MNDSRLNQALPIAFVILAAAFIGLLALVVTLNSRLNEAEADARQLQDDLQRIEQGAATAALQVTLFTRALADDGPAINAGLDEAVAGLDSFASSTISVDIDVDEVVPIETSIELNREIVVPIRTTIPIDETIETTIIVSGPLNTEIPVDVSVPVMLDFPLELDVPIVVAETIPIQTQVPIAVTVPVEIQVADTELATMATSLRDGLAALQDVLSALNGS